MADLQGHAPAGGCLLAVCCDYRVMAAPKFTIGLNETLLVRNYGVKVFHCDKFGIAVDKLYPLTVNDTFEIMSNNENFLKCDFLKIF